MKIKKCLYLIRICMISFSIFILIGCNNKISNATNKSENTGNTNQTTNESNNTLPTSQNESLYDYLAGTYNCTYTMPSGNYDISSEVGDRTIIRFWSDNTAVFITEMLSTNYYADAEYTFADNTYTLTMFYGDTMLLVLNDEKKTLTLTNKHPFHEELTITTYEYYQSGIETGIEYYTEKSGLSYEDYLMTNINHTEYSMEISYILKGNGTGTQRFYINGQDINSFLAYESSFNFDVKDETINFRLSNIEFTAEYIDDCFKIDLTDIANQNIAKFYANMMSKTSSSVKELKFIK